MKLYPKYFRHVDEPVPRHDAEEAQPITIVNLPTGGGEGKESDAGIGREILNVEGSTDLKTISDFDKYSFIDVRGDRTETYQYIDLPKASDYGAGRVLYINDKLGNVNPDSWSSRITVRAADGEGVDGLATRAITEKNGYVALRATEPGPLPFQEWQVVGENSPKHHTNGGFSNWSQGDISVGEGYVRRVSGAHVYTPIKMELYDGHKANKFVARYYPTQEMAEADKNRGIDTPAPEGINVLNEFIVGGDLPATSYGTGGVVSSWDNKGEPSNTYYITYSMVEGTAGRLSARTYYKDMVTVPK